MTCVLNYEVEILLVGKLDGSLDVFHSLYGHGVVRDWLVFRKGVEVFEIQDNYPPRPGSQGSHIGDSIKHWSSPISHKVAA
jgi:hypothetical protein